MDSSQQIRVLTLNCWGLPDAITKTVYRKYKDPKVSGGRYWPKRTERFQAIANKLDSYDIVCLQEVWIKKDQDSLASICKEKGLPYSHVFSSGLLGSSGLQIISRFPIKEVWYHRYRVNGNVYRVDQGDYHAGKGFGYARVEISPIKNIDVVLTHTIAQYTADDAYRADRLSQVWELIRFLQLISKPDRPIVVVGDMNSKHNSIEYAMFTKVGELVDAYGVANSDVTPTPESITSLDATPQRLDYVFFKKCKSFQLLSSKVVMNEKDIIYSDHFGVSATFAFSHKDTTSQAKITKEKLSNTANYGEEVEESDEKLNSSILEQCAALIIVGTEKAQKRKTTHLIRCLIYMMILWLLVSSSASFIYVGVITLLALVDFFIAIFHIENEISALREVHKEIRYFH